MGETHVVAAEVVDGGLGEHGHLGSLVFHSFVCIVKGDIRIQAQTCGEEGSWRQ